MFCEHKKEVMYRLIDTGKTYTWGAKTLTARQTEVLDLRIDYTEIGRFRCNIYKNAKMKSENRCT